MSQYPNVFGLCLVPVNCTHNGALSTSQTGDTQGDSTSQGAHSGALSTNQTGGHSGHCQPVRQGAHKDTVNQSQWGALEQSPCGDWAVTVRK